MSARRNSQSAQLEAQWSDPEPFTLVTQEAIDGDRVARESDLRTAARQSSEKLQPPLLP